MMVETHSDALTLRVRAALAERRLSPEQVRLYFVDDASSGHTGSIVREIRLNDRGTPDWWPDGVFAEPHLEFKRIRRALAYVPPEAIILAPDCGMKYLPREVAVGKLAAMVEAARILRAEH